MLTKKILFRADGCSIKGLGHLYRLFSLVEMVKNKFEFVFLTRDTSALSVIPELYNTVVIPKTVTLENEPEWLNENFSYKEYIIIADGYQFIASYQKKIKDIGYALIYVDDLANEHMYADVVVNHSPYIKKTHYNKEAYTKLALGTKFALLRPLFLKEAKENKMINVIDAAFVCFGGADPFNLTLKAVEALLMFPKFKYLHVVLGGAYVHKEISDLAEKNANKINIYRNLSEKNLVKIMQKCNFAIAPASTILFELSCVKMPIFSGFYVDNQELIYNGFSKNNAIYKGGDMRDYQVLDFERNIELILKEQKFNHQIEAQKRLFDNDIVVRHLNLINELCIK